MARNPTPTPTPTREHRYAAAAYRVYRIEGGAFGVEVTVEGELPTKITSFASRAAANRWVVEHKQTVERQSHRIRAVPTFIQRRRST
jgi:hypothetical protein